MNFYDRIPSLTVCRPDFKACQLIYKLYNKKGYFWLPEIYCKKREFPYNLEQVPLFRLWHPLLAIQWRHESKTSKKDDVICASVN